MSLPSPPIKLEVVGEEQPVLAAEADRELPDAVRKRLLDRHWTMLIVSLFVLAMSFALSIQETTQGGSVRWGGVKFPPLCGSRVWLGVECPGCGLTRSFIAIAAGDFRESLRFHRVGWLLWLAVVLQIPFRIYSLWEMRTSVTERRWPSWFGHLLIAALIGNWMLKTVSL
jgi:hypothetical protein